MQKISFTVDGLELAGTIFYPENRKEKNPAILFVQGWTGEKKRSYQYADALSQLGYICLLFDNKGHGESEGDIKTFTIREFLNGVLAAYDYLSDFEDVDKENISAVGSSFGGYLIAQLSEKRRLKKLVLRAAANYPDTDFDKSKYQMSGGESPEIFAWREQVRNPNETTALKAINGFDGDVLIIESEKDTVVPHQTIENYINAVRDKNKLTYIVVKDAPHSIKEGPFRDEITKILTEWFKAKI